MLDTATTTSTERVPQIPSAHVGRVDWCEADRQLRGIACRRTALDVEEARWLLAAERAEVHRHLGCGSFLEYLERVLGYGPRVAMDRMRVARAVEIYPLLREAMRSGEVAFSAARELARVRVSSAFGKARWDQCGDEGTA